MKQKDEPETLSRSKSVGKGFMNLMLATEESLVEYYGQYSIKEWRGNNEFNEGQIKEALKKYADMKGKDQF